jgi:hypothetical protein
MHIVVLNIDVNGQNMFMNYTSDAVRTRNDMFLLKKDVVDTVAKSKQLKIEKISVLGIYDTHILNQYAEQYVTFFVTVNGVGSVKDVILPNVPETPQELASLKITLAQKIETETNGTIGDLVLLGIIPLSQNMGVDLIGGNTFQYSAIAQ